MPSIYRDKNGHTRYQEPKLALASNSAYGGGGGFAPDKLSQTVDTHSATLSKDTYLFAS